MDGDEFAVRHLVHSFGERTRTVQYGAGKRDPNLGTRAVVFIRLAQLVSDWKTQAHAVRDLGAFSSGDSFQPIVRWMNGSEVDLAAKRKRPPLSC